MANNQINRLLEFSTLQLAAEAFLLRGPDAGVLPPNNELVERLKVGNNHGTYFTPLQADQFITKYQILAQFRNDPLLSGNTGFSATLIKRRDTGELTLSIRSTEFFDDPVRDSKSTNDLELKDLGWGFGQIAELEAWYSELRNNTAFLSNGTGGVRSFNVTGYSLGGHLATAFNILRSEEHGLPGAAPNPVIATYTFNGSGVSEIRNERTLTQVIVAFNRIRADYANSFEWVTMTPGEQENLARSARDRVDAINAEYDRVRLLGNLNPSFGSPSPTGHQAQLGYQIAALLAFRNTAPMLNPIFPTSINFIPLSPIFANQALRFGNMIEVVGMELSPLARASSFISNSGIHYGSRQEVHIENQPLWRGNWAEMFLRNFPSLLLNDPQKNNFADTHSLVLLIDSLSLMAAMEKLSPALSIEEAGQLYAAISNNSAITIPGRQGKSEGDTVERMLDALRKLIFGPAVEPVFTDQQMRAVLNGNTWHDQQYRVPFHDKLKELRDRIDMLVGSPGVSFTIDPLVATSAAQLTSLAQGATAPAYRYALRELNPFAVVGATAGATFYDQHNAQGELDLYDPQQRRGQLTSEWITDRATFLDLKSAANIVNATITQSATITEVTRFLDIPQNYSLTVHPQPLGLPGDPIRHFLFGGERADSLSGGVRSDRLYGGGGQDRLYGGRSADHLEGGNGLDLYEYVALASPQGPINDGDDIIRDIDGKGALSYTYRPSQGAVRSIIISDASDKRSATEWLSANGKVKYTKAGADLIITFIGDADGSITIKDFKNGDLGIHLRDPRPVLENPTRVFLGDKEDYDADPNASGIQAVADGFGNVQRADGLGGRPDIPSANRADLFFGSVAAGDIEFFQLGDGNDQALADGDQLYPATGGVAWMQGGSGRDMLHGGPANDLIEAGGDGVLLGETGGDTAFGGFGDDELYGDVKVTLAQAVAQGESGFATGLKGDFLSGAPGDDWIIGSTSNDYLDGGSGNDLLLGGVGDDNIAGDFGYGAITPNWMINREIVTESESTTYRLVFASGMTLFDSGVAGADVIYAGNGNDWIFGNDGDDYIDAGGDNDVAFGEAGADVLIGDAGDDRLVGDNPGFVTAAAEGGDILSGGGGKDELFGNGGDDILLGGDDRDVLVGDAGADILTGDAGNDVLIGDVQTAGSGVDERADHLDGGDGDDSLYGNGGNDTLVGGRGNDLLSGGAGRDTYVFNRGDGNDTIVDTDTSANNPEASVLILGEGVDRDAIKFRVGSLLVDLGNGDGIHIGGFDPVTPSNSTPIAEIQLFDGTVLSYEDILAQGFDIDGTEGNDNSQPGESPNLIGTGVTDRIRGLGGNDVLFGMDGDDALDGGDGADTLVGGDGADVVHAGLGADHAEGSAGDDQLFGEADADTLYGQAGGDIIDGGDGNDALYGDGVYLVIDQFVLNLFDDSAVDTLRGGSGADYLNAAGGDDALEGGDGNDQLLGEGGNDSLQGDAGDDTLAGGAGDDNITGGAGRDTLQGHDGNDTYHFAVGDGEDTLADPSGATTDIIRYGAAVAASDIHFAHGSNGSLVAWHDNAADQVTIQSWFLGTANKLDHFEFADATQISAAQAEALAATSWRGGSGNDTLLASSTADNLHGLEGNDSLSGGAGDDILLGGGGDDTMDGGAGADTYRISLGNGRDRILESNEFANNAIVFDSDVARADIAFSRVGSDLVLSHANNADRVTVDNWFASINWYRIETITFASDAVSHTRFEIWTLATQIDHQYTLDLGEGAKLIEDWGGIDSLTFGAGMAKADVQASRVNDDLKLAHANGLDHVTIKDWFNTTEKQIETVGFSGTGESFSHAELTNPFLILNGTPGNDTLDGGDAYGESMDGLGGHDTIHGRGGPDRITGGTGNDVVYGGSGADRYFFKAGDGVDIINEEGGDASVLQLSPGLVDLMSVALISGGGRRVTFAGSSDTIDILETGFGRTLIKGEINGTSAGNTINGNNTFGDVIQGLGGNDTLNGLGGNDEIHGGIGNDTIVGGDGDDQLWGDDGDDIIDGNVLGGTGIYLDEFWGGRGNDTLYGGYRDNRYHYDRGDGLDLIIEEPFLNQFNEWVFSIADQLVFGPDITVGSLTMAPAGNDLLVTISSSEKITLRNWISDYQYRIDEFVFSDGSKLTESEILLLAYTQRGTSGNDTLTGTTNNDALHGMGGNDTLLALSGNDLLDGGTGNDTIDGGTGDDRYLFVAGGGQDRIVDAQGSDRIEFAAGVTASEIVLSRAANSMVLGIAATPDTLTIDNALASSSARIETFSFTDGSTLPAVTTIVDSLVNVTGGSGNDLLQGTAYFDVLYGHAGDDTLTALADNDVLYGGADNDILNGGAGNDTLQGEQGNDVYNYFVGDGTDVVNDVSGTDRVAFGAGIATTAVTTARSGANLVLTVNVAGNPGAVTVTNYFAAQETEAISFADGTTWDVATVRSKVLAAASTAGNDVILGYESADTINSLAGNDTVYAGAGDDVINGGTGSDTLYGEDGNDVVNAGSGDSKSAAVNNFLYGGNGNDVLVASDKTDTLAGDAGNDVLLGAGANETLQDTAGNNLLFGAAGADIARAGDGNDIVLGGTGNEAIDGDIDANGVRGIDIIAFNKSDGIDSVSRLGAGSTISIGGGTTYSNLSFAVSGANLLLKTGSSHYLSLTNWYGAPSEKTVSTLQIVTEGTSNYNAGSSNPLNNRKIQTFNFLSLVSAYDAAGRPTNFNIANNLAAHRIGGSDTMAIGGAAAYQYARTGTLGTLTNAQLQAVIGDPAFGASAQTITATAAAQSAAMNQTSGDLAAEPSAESPMQLAGPSTQSTDAFAFQESPATLAAGARDAAIASAHNASSANDRSAHADAGLEASRFDEKPQIAAYRALAAAELDSAALIDRWFESASADDDLSLLDDILRGDDAARTTNRSAIAAEWERSHQWLVRNAQARFDEDATPDAAGAPAFSYLGVDGLANEVPRAAVGITEVAGHELKIFRGLHT